VNYGGERTVIHTRPSYAGSIDLYQQAAQVLAGGVSSNFRLGGDPVPLFFTHGQGAHLFDVDGNAFIDYVLGMGPNILGHAPGPVISAVAASLSRGQLFAGQHQAEVELGRRVQALVPCAELVRFGSSGSEMDQAAVRLARAHTGRPRVVKFEGHYHGWFDTLLVSIPGAGPGELGPRAAPTPHLPSAGQSVAAASDVTVLPWNDLEALATYLETHAPETAAVLMEPICCNTSVILPRAGYLEGVRALCDQYGVVLIFDEVITGFRVGPGGAQARLGVTPDLAVFAKALGGGFPIAAVAGRRRIMEHLATGRALHGGSFNSNVPSTVAALATLEVLAAEGGAAYASMEARGERLMAGLRALARAAGLPLRVQGLGSVFNTAFGGPEEILEYRDYTATDLGRQRQFLIELQHQGVRVTSRGTWFLSTAHSDTLIEQTLEAAERALAALAKRAG
jgi:glutamate-1-semialdehyde 2,1-aminomutase